MKTLFPIICLILLIIEIIILCIRLYIVSKNEPENYEDVQGKILAQFLFTGGALGFVLCAIF
jgi:hypothetical protein